MKHPPTRDPAKSSSSGPHDENPTYYSQSLRNCWTSLNFSIAEHTPELQSEAPSMRRFETFCLSVENEALQAFIPFAVPWCGAPNRERQRATIGGVLGFLQSYCVAQERPRLGHFGVPLRELLRSQDLG